MSVGHVQSHRVLCSEGHTTWLKCSAIAILILLINLPLYLRFISEVQWDSVAITPTEEIQVK